MRYLAKEQILCFSKEELTGLYKKSKIPELAQEMVKKGVSFDDLRKNPILMQEIADIVGERGAADRDEHEIFAALFSFSRFYEPTCEICFQVNRTFNPNNPSISTITDLNRYRQGVNTSDFFINSSDGFRQFELKRYREEMDAEHLFNFIREKVAHYANNLGDTNLLIQLQPIPYSKADIDFQKIHNDLVTLNFAFQGQILISFNQNNERHILVQVYPEILKHEIPMEFPGGSI